MDENVLVQANADMDTVLRLVALKEAVSTMKTSEDCYRAVDIAREYYKFLKGGK